METVQYDSQTFKGEITDVSSNTTSISQEENTEKDTINNNDCKDTNERVCDTIGNIDPDKDSNSDKIVTASLSSTNTTENASSESNDDLEEGECSSDEEEVVPVVPEQIKNQENEEKKKDRKHRHRSRSRSRSRDRHKSKKKKKDKKHSAPKEEISEEEQKRRAMVKKMKALEADMGLYDDYYNEENETPMGSEGTESEGSSDSESHSSSPSPTKRKDKKRKRDREERHAKRKRRRHERHRVEGKDEVCGLYMQGKCPKTAKECLYSHDAEPPQVWELCKFYLFDRCAKRDKCLYLHKGFPCKYFHTGRQCPDTAETCKFSHEPLNDTTRTLMLKHIESAPKEILGEFPRMTRGEAANSIFQTEAKNKGWITEGPNAVLPPVIEDDDEEVEMDESEEQDTTSSLQVPSHIKLDPIQEKLLKQSQQSSSSRGNNSRWGGNEAGPPLAVQQAMAMEGGRNTQFGPMAGVQGHGVRNNGAFNQGPVRRQTVGLLGPPPDQMDGNPWSGSPFGGLKKNPPEDLMKISINEEEVQGFLNKQRIEAAKVHEEERSSEDGSVGYERDPWKQSGGDETPEVTPPVSREDTPTPSDEQDFESKGSPKQPKVKLPKAQMKLYQRIQQKQVERRISQGNENVPNENDQEENWYSDEDEQENKDVLANVLKKLDSPQKSPTSDKPALGAPFTLANLNLPPSLTNVLTAISQGGNLSNGNNSPVDQTDAHYPKKEKRIDPRKARSDPRKDKLAQKEEEAERDKRLIQEKQGVILEKTNWPKKKKKQKEKEKE